MSAILGHMISVSGAIYANQEQFGKIFKCFPFTNVLFAQMRRGLSSRGHMTPEIFDSKMY